jgi:hypothetical protein
VQREEREESKGWLRERERERERDAEADNVLVKYRL